MVSLRIILFLTFLCVINADDAFGVYQNDVYSQCTSTGRGCAWAGHHNNSETPNMSTCIAKCIEQPLCGVSVFVPAWEVNCYLMDHCSDRTSSHAAGSTTIRLKDCATGERCFDIHENVNAVYDLAPNPYDDPETLDPFSCEEKCYRNDTCHLFAWHSERFTNGYARKCVMWSENDARSKGRYFPEDWIPDDGVVTGARRPDICHHEHGVELQCNGDDCWHMHFSDVKNQNECETRCRDRAECGWWTFITGISTQCSMFNHCAMLQKAENPRAVSANLKECTVDLHCPLAGDYGQFYLKPTGHLIHGVWYDDTRPDFFGKIEKDCRGVINFPDNPKEKKVVPFAFLIGAASITIAGVPFLLDVRNPSADLCSWPASAGGILCPFANCEKGACCRGNGPGQQECFERWIPPICHQDDSDQCFNVYENRNAVNGVGGPAVQHKKLRDLAQCEAVCRDHGDCFIFIWHDCSLNNGYACRCVIWTQQEARNHGRENVSSWPNENLHTTGIINGEACTKLSSMDVPKNISSMVDSKHSGVFIRVNMQRILSVARGIITGWTPTNRVNELTQIEAQRVVNAVENARPVPSTAAPGPVDFPVVLAQNPSHVDVQVWHDFENNPPSASTAFHTTTVTNVGGRRVHIEDPNTAEHGPHITVYHTPSNTPGPGNHLYATFGTSAIARTLWWSYRVGRGRRAACVGRRCI